MLAVSLRMRTENTIITSGYLYAGEMQRDIAPPIRARAAVGWQNETGADIGTTPMGFLMSLMWSAASAIATISGRCWRAPNAHRRPISSSLLAFLADKRTPAANTGTAGAACGPTVAAASVSAGDKARSWKRCLGVAQRRPVER